MNKIKLPWLRIVIIVTSIIIAVPIIYHLLEKEHYPWQQDAEVLKISDNFKGINPGPEGSGSRRPEGWTLFPIIKLGMTTREVQALLGTPSLITTNGGEQWHYTLFYSEEIQLTITDGKVVEKDML